MDHNENLQHNNIAGVPDDDDPILNIEAAGIPDDDLVGVPIAGVNDKQQQELENNENAIQQFDNNNYISDDKGAGNNQPDNYVSDDAQTENEPDALNTDEDEVDTGITENTEAGSQDENSNEDESKDDDDNNNHQPDGPHRSKRKNKVKLKAKGPYKFENNSLAHRSNENARKMVQLHIMKHEVSALMEYARICAQVHCTTGVGFYEDIMRHPLTETLFTQYSVRKGINVFREAGITEVEEELQQLETRKSDGTY